MTSRKTAIRISKSTLKPKLLGYLRQVEKNKEPVIVTDRGRAIAKILPYSEDSESPEDELKGSVIRFDEPCEPVGEEDWEALKK